MFKRLHLFETMSELASENINGYIYSVSIHEYIQNKCLTYICEVGDPILSQNLDRKYVVSKDKQGGEMRENTRRCFKNCAITFFGSMYKQKSRMAHEYAGHHGRARTNFLNWHDNAHTKHNSFVGNEYVCSSFTDNISVSFGTLFAVESDPYCAP